VTTTHTENKAIVRSLVDAMDRGDVSILDVVCAPEFRGHFMGSELDLAQVKRAASGFHAAFPDLKHASLDLVAEGDRVALRALDRGTHRGVYKGIEPTGRRVEFETIAIYRIVGGKIVEAWQQMDVPGLLRQLQT
jgi:predicted ester cyclase